MTKPIEYLSFKNGLNLWQYTNSNQVEQIGPRSFSPLAYKRNEPTFSKESTDGQLRIVVPSSIPLIGLYGPTPSSFTTTVTIEKTDRLTPGSEAVYWSGQIVSVQRQGKFATILAAPFTALPSQVPRYQYTALCNWVLFQDECGLQRQDFRHTSTVLSIESPTTFTVDGLGAQAAALAASAGGNLTQAEIDTYWLGGYVETGLGEKRPIFEANVSGVSDRIRIVKAFENLNVNDSVIVYAGCSRTRDICNRKFENNLRHGGFPDIPIVNPFNTELPTGGSSTEKKNFFINSG